MATINDIRLKSILDNFGQMGGGTYDPQMNPVNEDESMDNSIPPNLRALGTPAPEPPTDEESDPYPKYEPQTAATKRFEELLNQYPQEKPLSLGRAIVAGGMAGGSKGSYKDAEDFMHGPQNRAVNDWKNSTEGAYHAAQLENTANATERSAVSNVISARVAADRLVAAEKKSQAELALKQKIADQKNEIEQAKLKGFTFSVINGHLVGHKLDGTTVESDLDLRNMTALEIANLTTASRERVAAASNETKQAIADEKGWGQPVMIADPNDPTKQIAVQTHLGTGEVREVKLGGKNVGPITKPSSGAGKLVQPVNIQAIQSMAQETLQALDKLIDEKGNLTPTMKGYYGNPVTTRTGELPLPTDARTARTQHKRAMDLLVTNLIGEMKNQSRTGATGFGQLSIPELQLLQSAATGIDIANKPEVTTARLIEIRNKVRKVLLPADGNTPTSTQPRTELQISIDEALKKKNKGGQP